MLDIKYALPILSIAYLYIVYYLRLWNLLTDDLVYLHTTFILLLINNF